MKFITLFPVRMLLKMLVPLHMILALKIFRRNFSLVFGLLLSRRYFFQMATINPVFAHIPPWIAARKSQICGPHLRGGIVFLACILWIKLILKPTLFSCCCFYIIFQIWFTLPKCILCMPCLYNKVGYNKISKFSLPKGSNGRWIERWL